MLNYYFVLQTPISFKKKKYRKSLLETKAKQDKRAGCSLTSFTLNFLFGLQTQVEQLGKQKLALTKTVAFFLKASLSQNHPWFQWHMKPTA